MNQLRPADANTLIKYGTFLREQEEVDNERRQKFQEELGRLSTEELVELYHKMKDKVENESV